MSDIVIILAINIRTIYEVTTVINADASSGRPSKDSGIAPRPMALTSILVLPNRLVLLMRGCTSEVDILYIGLYQLIVYKLKQ